MNMKRTFVLTFAVCLATLVCAVIGAAQDPRIVAAAGDQYVISAKAGGVNYVEGKVTVFRKNGTSGFLLARDELEIGDRVSTGPDGKAEILLNPGSYLRLGGSTAFEFVTTSLDDLRLKLKTGSAIFEVIAADEFRVSVQLPQTKIGLTRSGVFRIDVLTDGSSRLSVMKGKAFVGPNGMTAVESGRSATIAGGGISVSKFDKDSKDPLDVWSRDRAKELTKVNARLQGRTLRNTLLNSYNQRGWNMYNSFGLWVFDPSRRMWCFLPFGSGWGSPYGWDYGFDVWNCRLPRWIYWDPPPPGPGSGGGGTGGGPPVNTPILSMGDRSPIPPFIRMQNQGGGGSSDDNVVIRGGRNRDFSDPSPSTPSAPPASSPPIYSPPPAAPSDSKGKPDR